MSLEEILDVCFSGVYIPHVLDLIYRYLWDFFDLKYAKSIPAAIYLELLKENTKLENDHGFIKFYINGKQYLYIGPVCLQVPNCRIYSAVDVIYYDTGVFIRYTDNIHEYTFDVRDGGTLVGPYLL